MKKIKEFLYSCCIIFLFNAFYITQLDASGPSLYSVCTNWIDEEKNQEYKKKR